jgi:hypothetical protein
MIVVGGLGLAYGSSTTYYNIWLVGGIVGVVIGLVSRKVTGRWRRQPHTRGDRWDAGLS